MRKITGTLLIELAGDRQEITLVVTAGFIEGVHVVKLMKGRDDMFHEEERRARYGDNGCAWFLFSSLRDGGWNSHIKEEYFKDYPHAWCLGRGLSEGLVNISLAPDITLYDLL